MIGLDFGAVLVNLWKFWKQDQELQAWIKLGLSTFYSGFIAFTGVCGAGLSAGGRWSVSIGSGLLACSVAVLAVLLRSPQARSLMLSVPQSVIEKYQDAQGQTTIEPTDGKQK